MTELRNAFRFIRTIPLTWLALRKLPRRLNNTGVLIRTLAVHPRARFGTSAKSSIAELIRKAYFSLSRTTLAPQTLRSRESSVGIQRCLERTAGSFDVVAG
jgi:hypothetical protein